MFRKVIYNTSAQLVGKSLSAAAAFFSTLLLARALGSSSYGQYTIAVTYIAFFYPLIDFGLNLVYLRETKDRALTNFGKLLGLRLFLGVVLISGALLGGKVVAEKLAPVAPTLFSNITLASLSIILYGLSLSATAIFQQRLKYQWPSAATILGAVATLAFILIVLPKLQQPTPSAILIATLSLVIGAGVTAGANLIFLKKEQILLRIKLDGKLWKNWGMASLPLGLTLLFNLVYFRVDTLILSVHRPVSEVGAYGLAYKFFEFALVLPTFFMNSVYPELLQVTQTQLLNQRLKQIFLILGGTALILTSGLWLVSPWLTLIRTDFAPAIPLLRILCLGLPIFYLSSPLMWWFVLVKKLNVLAAIYGATMVFNIVANLTVIPHWGAVGAAYVTGVTEMGVLFLGIGYIIFR